MIAMKKHQWIAWLGMVLSGYAVAASTTPLVTVTGPSPLGGCTLGGPGTNYVNAEVEPWVSVNPVNNQNIIGAWQQDRWDNGGSHGLVAGYSFDGGMTWGHTVLPFTACSGGLGYERASDPWVSIGPDGTAYTISISFNQSNNANAVATAVSKDGGKTWGNLSVLIANNEPTTQFFNDKESVTADPYIAGTAYAVWDRLELPNGNPYANLHTQAFRGPSLFSKTTNGGQTWSPPQVIVSTPSRQQTIGNQIVVGRDGTLYDFFNLIKPPFSAAAGKVAFIRSNDGGATWSKPQIVADLRTVGVVHPNTGHEVRTGDIIPEPAVDPRSGRLYVVWQDSRFNGGQYDEVALSSSGDGGVTWTPPVRVNKPTGRPAFTPSVRVNSQGIVGVSYYDFRSLTTQTATLPTDYWLTMSGDEGATFNDEVSLVPTFDMAMAPDAGGYFVGDYEGLDVAGPRFVPFFVKANDGNTANRTDVVTRTVTP